MNVLVLNYFSRNSLAVVHGLPRDCRIIGADESRKSRRSRAWERVLRHPRVETIERYASSDAAPETFVRDLIRICRYHGIDLVIPTGTTATDALSRFKADIEQAVDTRCAVTGYDRLVRATDKWHAYQLAIEAGVPVPETRLFDPVGQDVMAQVEGMRFPLVVKPRISYAAIGVHHVEDVAGLRSVAKELACDAGAQGSPCSLIAQEQVDGNLNDVAACAQVGRALTLVTQQRLVSLYDFGGGGIVNITTRDAELQGHARRLLAFLEWDGPMLFDFIRAPDGKVYLLECNPKIWGTTDLVLEAGPGVIQMMLGIFGAQTQVEAVDDYEEGLLYRWWVPECLYHWFHRPFTMKALVARLGRTAGRYRARRVVSNLRFRDLGHLAGIAANRLIA